ncbi:MAG: hypothetical protein WCD18_17265 [Thermosynechococcaceae cyanobacterium]
MVGSINSGTGRSSPADADLRSTTTNVSSGIAVPSDVSSLTDLLKYVDWPIRYRYEAIKNWQRVN